MHCSGGKIEGCISQIYIREGLKIFCDGKEDNNSDVVVLLAVK